MTPQNARFSQLFTVVDADGNPYVITGKSLQLDIKDQPGSEAAHSFSTGNGGLVIVAANQFSLVASRDLMSSLTPDRYWWDTLNLTDDSMYLGGGYWDIGVGITNSDTPFLPGLEECDDPSVGMVLILAGDGVTLRLAAAGPPAVANIRRVAPVQTADFTFTDEFDDWPIDATDNDVTATTPLGSDFPNRKWGIVRVDAGKPTTTFSINLQMSGSDTWNGLGSVPNVLYAAWDSTYVKNYSTVNGGTAWSW